MNLKRAETAHTPTPWHIEPSASASNILDKDNRSVATMDNPYPLGASNAAHIVKCVNAYEELLRLVKELSEIPLLSETPGIAKGVEWSEMDELICKAREAIAKAEGK